MDRMDFVRFKVDNPELAYLWATQKLGATMRPCPCTNTDHSEDRKEVCWNDNFVPYSALLQSNLFSSYCLMTCIWPEASIFFSQTSIWLLFLQTLYAIISMQIWVWRTHGVVNSTIKSRRNGKWVSGWLMAVAIFRDSHKWPLICNGE